MHESKLKRKLSSFRKVIVDKDRDLKELLAVPDKDEKADMLLKVMTEDVISQIADWGILPQAVTFADQLGAGAFGVVYKGIYRQREVAIKTMTYTNITKANLERFVGEVLLLTRLFHPNLIGFVGAVLEVENIFMLMEFASRGDLRQTLQANPTWTFGNHKLRVLMEITKGVEYLHSVGVIHRDLKCENVLVTEHYQCKISDFGESRDVAENTMTMVGTPMYLAPEVFRGEVRSGEELKAEGCAAY